MRAILARYCSGAHARCEPCRRASFRDQCDGREGHREGIRLQALHEDGEAPPGDVRYPRCESHPARLQDGRPPLEDDRSGEGHPPAVTLNPGRYLFAFTVDSHAELGIKWYLLEQR
jgi:hypothetical protein